MPDPPAVTDPTALHSVGPPRSDLATAPRTDRPRRPDKGPVLVVLAGGRARRYGGCKPLAPVGPDGEAVIDLLASDALTAGFGTIVLVVGPTTGPAIRYHVTRRWPGEVNVHFAVQHVPLGTVHAVLAAGDHLLADAAFGVSNADDLYGAGALELLARHLLSEDPHNAIVAFHLQNATIGDAPVTRGVCAVDSQGMLVSVDERRQVHPVGDGCFVAKDGREPAELDGDTLVSMNLWGFTPGMRTVLTEAMASASEASEDAEVLLPEVVGDLLAGRRAAPDPAASKFVVYAAESRVVGVTHPDDLALVQADLAMQVGSGERPATLWTALQ